ncbi:aldose 1-epimerase family protein [Leucobacter allii]|uniref:Aldose 1-epimerase family protein n=1 Tax=Leucobacter allii TaxID=2932247 RepID=A0ABY4FRM8_9MICO|nr:aldose 1-epimerase family protein [Leucobacter allii]UOQ58948.1 aldose 1-epimerase family protein [Leucobacter allii]
MSGGPAAGGPASGRQFPLVHGAQRAVVASIGASLRSYRIGERDLIVPFAAEEPAPVFRGLTVAPWPNRVVDGRYRFRGAAYRLPVTEPARGHALHGFTRGLDFAPVGHDGGEAHEHVADDDGIAARGGTAAPASAPRESAAALSGAPASAAVPSAAVPSAAVPSAAPTSAVTLRAVIAPSPGYPWRIRLDVRYALGEAGLTQTVTATNLGEGVAPYGVCPHPYLVAGPGPLDAWQLALPAERVMETVGERLLPGTVRGVGVDAERFDFREPRRIGEAVIDHAFTDVARDAGGRARLELRAADGGGVAMVWGSACPWVQLCTADAPAGAADPGHRAGLAVEPMSCAPDAFNAGESAGLVALAPGSAHRAEWRIEPLPAA